jgi:hypothetical protein
MGVNSEGDFYLFFITLKDEPGDGVIILLEKISIFVENRLNRR